METNKSQDLQGDVSWQAGDPEINGMVLTEVQRPEGWDNEDEDPI